MFAALHMNLSQVRKKMLRSEMKWNFYPSLYPPAEQDMSWCSVRNTPEGISDNETTEVAVLTDMWQAWDVRIWNNQKQLINSKQMTRF